MFKVDDEVEMFKPCPCGCEYYNFLKDKILTVKNIGDTLVGVNYLENEQSYLYYLKHDTVRHIRQTSPIETYI